MATLTIRPNGAGAYTNLEVASGTHWQQVDEVTHDGNSTYVATVSPSLLKDAYALTNHTTEQGTISSVKVYAVCHGNSDGETKVQLFVRLGTSETAGSLTIMPNDGTFRTYSATLARPGGGSYSWSDIDNLQACIGMLKTSGDGGYAVCTQVYVVVTYTIPPQTVYPSAIASAEALGSPTLTTGGVNVAPTGIASAEAFGTLNLLFDQTVVPSAITSAEAFGSAQLNLTLLLTAIASAEAIGTLTIIPGSVNIAPGGIASAEAFGTPRVARVGYIEPTGIASLEAFGTPQLNLKLEPSGIASAEALGTAKLVLYLNPSAIASAEAFGSPQLNLLITPQGIPTAEALGAPTILWELFLLPSAIASGEALGTPQLNLKLEPSGIASLEAFGSPQLNLFVPLTGISSAEAFGTAKLLLYLLPSSIASGEAFGTPQVLWELFLLPASIASAELFGTPNLYVILASGDGMKLPTDKGQAAIFHE